MRTGSASANYNDLLSGVVSRLFVLERMQDFPVELVLLRHDQKACSLWLLL